MLTEQQYKEIAEVIKESTQFPSPDYKQIFAEGIMAGGQRVACEMTDYFAAHNPCFDRDSFLIDCGTNN